MEPRWEAIEWLFQPYERRDSVPPRMSTLKMECLLHLLIVASLSCFLSLDLHISLQLPGLSSVSVISNESNETTVVDFASDPDKFCAL